MPPVETSGDSPRDAQHHVGRAEEIRKRAPIPPRIITCGPKTQYRNAPTFHFDLAQEYPFSKGVMRENTSGRKTKPHPVYQRPLPSPSTWQGGAHDGVGVVEEAHGHARVQQARERRVDLRHGDAALGLLARNRAGHARKGKGACLTHCV